MGMRQSALYCNSCKTWMRHAVSRGVGKVGVSLCVRQRSAVLPETPVQLLPITAGMYPWVGCHHCSSILLMWWPPASATCEMLTFHTQILPMNPRVLFANIRTTHSNCCASQTPPGASRQKTGCVNKQDLLWR